MKQARFDPAAAAELDEAIAYLEAQSEGLGAKLKLEVTRALARIAAGPQHYASVGRSKYRKYLVRRFRYHVVYSDYPDFIWIVAVAHASRHPGYWRGRQPPG